MSDNPFVGSWTYRSLLNDPDINKAFNDLVSLAPEALAREIDPSVQTPSGPPAS